MGRHFPLTAAESLASVPECRAENLSDPALIEGLIDTFAVGRYADYVKLLGQLQTRLLCLPRVGTRGYDVWFARIFGEALLAPHAQQQRLVWGLLNPALLVFDQIQYTGNSAIYYIFHKNLAALRGTLSGYPYKRVQLFLFGPGSGRLLAFPGVTCLGANCRPTFDNILDMFGEPERIWPGWCRLALTVDAGFRCRSQGACNARSGYSMVGEVTARHIGALKLGRAKVSDLEEILFLAELADVRFGLPFPAAAGIGCSVLGPLPEAPWHEPNDLISCLLAKREQFEQSVFCEPRLPSVDEAIEYAGVGSALWDPACVNPRQRFAESDSQFPGCEGKENCTEYQRDAFEPAVVNVDRSKARQTAADEVVHTAKRDLSDPTMAQSIAGAISQQCNSLQNPRCDSSNPSAMQAINTALGAAQRSAHYADGSPDGGSMVVADICPRFPTCSDGRTYGAIRFGNEFYKYLAEGQRGEALVTAVHEIMHLVYGSLGFDPYALVPPTDLNSPTTTIMDEYGNRVECNVGAHHCLIVQIAAHRGAWQDFYRNVWRKQYAPWPGVYKPKPFVPADPTPPFPDQCSAWADALRHQELCYSNLFDLGRGRQRTIVAPWKDPRKVNPRPDKDVEAPEMCEAFAGSTLPKVSLQCGLIHCLSSGHL